jgi:hypothetical protein
MGTCCTKPSSAKQPEKTTLPPIAEPDSLLYRIKLSNFRLKGLVDKKTLTLKVTFGSKEFLLPATASPYKWAESFSFEYVCSLERMSNESLSASMISSGREIASMSLELLTVALGPVHQDFSMNNGVKQLGRISFDAEMLQVTELVVSVKRLVFKLNDPVGSLYSAHFKLIADERTERDIGEPSPSPEWIFEEGAENVLKSSVTIDSVRQASLQFKLWRVNKRSQDLLAECWSSFTKLFKEDQSNTLFKPESLVYSTGTSLLANLSPNTKQTKAFNESCWLCGRQVGRITGILSISGMPRVYQMLSGVNTEKGPQLQANMIMENSKSMFKGKKSIPKEIIQLSSLSATLTELVSTRTSKSMGKSRQSRAISHRKTLHEVKQLLTASHRSTMSCLDYEKTQDVVTSQDIMLNIGMHLLEYAPIVMYDIQPFYYENLTLLLLRGELDLGYLTPLDSDQRQKMANRYVAFLRGCLVLAFKQLHFKGCDSRLQTFIETVFVVAYFRVSRFREVLLEAFKNNGLGPVPEWRGNVFDLMDYHEEAVLLPVLDWENNFYASLSDKSLEGGFLTALNNTKWQEKFYKRGIAYFRFIDRFAQHVKTQFVRTNIPWHAIPGYRVILHTFLLELKQRPTSAYPEALVKASCSLLSYRNLISAFVKIVFSKTNIYDYQSVVETLGLVDIWLDTLFIQGHSLPHSFDFSFFTEGLLTVLRDEHSVSLAKGLLLIYRQFHQLTHAVREAVVHKFLIKENFFRFFFHWHSEVRRVFLYMLVFRIVAATDLSLHDITEDKKLRKDTVKLLSQAAQASPEDLPTEFSVYLEPAQLELTKLEKRRDEWLASLRRKGSGVYGGFDTFPYPALQINCLLVDKREQMLELDW